MINVVNSSLQKDIGPIVVNLQTVCPGIFSVGTFIPQPGEWSIVIAAQRHADYDLNYKFTAKVPNAPAPTSTVPSQKTTTGAKPSSSSNANIVIDMNNNMQEPLPKFDSFAWLAIGLAIAVGFFSTYNKRSKQELRETIAMFEQRNAMQ